MFVTIVMCVAVISSGQKRTSPRPPLTHIKLTHKIVRTPKHEIINMINNPDKHNNNIYDNMNMINTNE